LGFAFHWLILGDQSMVWRGWWHHGWVEKV